VIRRSPDVEVGFRATLELEGVFER
jgi:hypothetical protein